MAEKQGFSKSPIATSNTSLFGTGGIGITAYSQKPFHQPTSQNFDPQPKSIFGLTSFPNTRDNDVQRVPANTVPRQPSVPATLNSARQTEPENKIQEPSIEKKACGDNSNRFPLPPNRPIAVEADVEAAMIPSNDDISANAWTSPDQAVIDVGLKWNSYHELWKLLIHKFQATPHDLLTWGLRLCAKEGEETIRALCELIPHPFWDGKLWLLRYVLQKAVEFRFKGHMSPLCPLRRSMVNSMPILRGSTDGLRINSMSRSELSTFALTMWDNSKPDFDPKVSALLNKVQGLVQGQVPVLDSPTGYLFYLQYCDIVHIRRALDALHQDGVFDHDVRGYYTGYLFSVNSTWNRMSPTNKEVLGRWEKANALRKKVDRERHEPDFPRREKEEQMRLAFWGSLKCDPRFKQCIFGDKN